MSCLYYLIINIIFSLFYFSTAKGKNLFFFSSVNGRYLFLNNVLDLFCYLHRFTSTWMSIMMRITSTLIWLRKLSEMKADGFEDSLCTDPTPLRKNRACRQTKQGTRKSSHSRTTTRMLLFRCTDFEFGEKKIN